MLVVKILSNLFGKHFPNELLHTGPIPAGPLNYQWIDQAKGLWGQFPSDGKGLNPIVTKLLDGHSSSNSLSVFTSMSIPLRTVAEC